MAKKKFSDIKRMAVWVGHLKKCQYCREPINYRELHIDHVIAEEQGQNHEQFKALLATLGLPPDFSIDSYLNLFPSHAACNLQKSNILFDQSSLHFYLNVARSRLPAILKEEERLKAIRYSEKLLLDLTLALGVGSITESQVSDVLCKGGYEGDFKKINYKPKFVDFEVDDYLSSKSVDLLLDSKIELGGGYITNFQMINDSGHKIEVETCRDVIKAIDNKFYPISTFDIKMYAFCVPVLGIVKALSSASTANETFVSEVGVTDIDLLPVNIFPNISPDESREFDIAAQCGVTVADWVKTGRIKVVGSSRYSLELETECIGARFRELIRADLNADGRDEILLYEYTYAKEGTFGSGGLRVLSRDSRDARFQHIAYS